MNRHAKLVEESFPLNKCELSVSAVVTVTHRVQ